jgi:type VI secretion system FHA domain protein
MLVLTVQSLNGAPTERLSASFDELGGTIGRADSNQLVLPDPERTISRVHAQVVYRNGTFAIADRGSNPVLINGLPVGTGREVPLHDGDTLTIGGYLIAVSRGQRATAPQDPFADLFGPPPTATPARPAAPAAVPAPPPATFVAPPTAPAPKPSPAPGARGGLPDDWDPFESSTARLAREDLPRPRASEPRIGDLPLAPTSREDSLDALFGLDARTPQGRDPLASSPLAAGPSAPNTAADVDPLRALQRAAPPPAAPVADHVSDLNTPWPASSLRMPAQPPSAPEDDDTIGTEAPVPEPVAAPARAAPGAADASRLTAALREGLGAPNLKLAALDEAQMRLIGQLLREAARGTVDLLHARAALKREMHATMTMIVARENNPLKFSPSADAALQHLLGPQVAGFMPPAEGMRDAYDDLRAHQLGVMAGMRAALDGVLQRFDPAVLEGRLARPSALAHLMPSSRKARLWELFQELYAQLSKEVADDFDELFGKAFLEAYQSQIDRLESDN